MVGVPTLWEAMLSNKRFEDVDLSDLKYMVSGGDTMTNGMEEKINNFLNFVLNQRQKDLNSLLLFQEMDKNIYQSLV